MNVQTDKKALARWKPDTNSQAIEHTRLDARMFAVTMDDLEGVAEKIDARACQEQNSGSVSRKWVHDRAFDFFASLFKSTPKVDATGADPLSRELIERAMRCERYTEAHAATRNDEVLAALEGCAIGEQVSKDIPDELKKQQQRAEAAKRESEEAQSLADMLDEDADADQDEIDEAKARAQSAAERAKMLTQQLAASVKNHGQQIAQVVERAVNKAADEATAMKVAMRSFGTNSVDPSGGMSVEDKLKLAQIVQSSGPAFRKMLDMLGRLVGSALDKQAAKMRHEAGEIVDITLGDNTSRMLATELATLVDPDLEVLALARIATHGAMLYDLEAREPQSRGDIVVLFDESGSMSGQREAEAKAVTLALAHVALKQKRSLVVHFFQSQVTATYTIDGKGGDLPGESGMSVALKTMSAMARRGTGGGTEFDPPLRAAIKTVSETHHDADVLMLTDGISRVSPAIVAELNAQRKQRGLNVFTMLFGYSTGDSAIEIVKQFSDRVWASDSLLNGAADELFSLI